MIQLRDKISGGSSFCRLLYVEKLLVLWRTVVGSKNKKYKSLC